MKERPIVLEIQPGEILARLTTGEAATLAAAWMQVFGRKPAPKTDRFMWHVFSCDAYPSVRRQAALDAYEAVAAAEYVVLSNARDQALVTRRKPTSCSLSDYYVFPRNLAWTMVFTHEDGWLGPYFAKHPQFEKLQDDNLNLVRKTQREVAAKQKSVMCPAESPRYADA